MNWDQKEILGLPQSCLLERRLTKAFFLKNFPLKSDEKKILNSTIHSMQWLASVKPSTTNIQSVKTEDYVFEELQIFQVTIPDEAFSKQKKIIALIHKYIPYQIVLILHSDKHLLYSVCDKRINKADTSKRTIESYVQTPLINLLYKRELEKQFLEQLQFHKLDKTNLATTYESYESAIVQYSSAQITGQFKVRDKRRTKEDLNLLNDIEAIELEIVSLKNQIKKATSFKEQTNLNVDVQKKRNTIKELKKKLV